MPTKAATKEIGFSRKSEAAGILVEHVKHIIVKSAQDYNTAEDYLKAIRTLEKDLEEEYKSHPTIIEAKRLQGIKGELATMLEAARKGLKNGQMLAFEQAEERKRIAEEVRLAKEAKASADAETAARVAEQKKEWEAAEKARKAAEKKGNEEAARAAAERAEAARKEAEQIKQDAANAPAVVVVVEKTAPSVARRTVPKFRITDESLIPRQFFSVDLVKIGGVVRSLRANHGIAGIEYFEELA